MENYPGPGNVVVVVPWTPVVDVVVVDVPVGAEVVVPPPAVVLVDVEGVLVLEPVVVLVLVGLLVDVVVVVVLVVDVVGPGEPPRFPTDVPDPAPPKIDESGFPAINSTAVMNSSATAKTTPAVPASAFRVGNGRGVAVPVASRPATAVEVAVAGPSSASRPGGSWRGPRAPPSGSSRDPRWSRTPDRRRRRGRPRSWGRKSLARHSPPFPYQAAGATDSIECRTTCTTTWRTASCPRSIDCATSAVPIVAAADPMATPTIVPLTPKTEAMTAARTAPATEARICRTENFTAEDRAGA